MGQEDNMKLLTKDGFSVRELIIRLIIMWIGSIAIIAFVVNTADWYGWLGSIFVMFISLFAWSYVSFILGRSDY